MNETDTLIKHVEKTDTLNKHAEKTHTLNENDDRPAAGLELRTQHIDNLPNETRHLALPDHVGAAKAGHVVECSQPEGDAPKLILSADVWPDSDRHVEVVLSCELHEARDVATPRPRYLAAFVLVEVPHDVRLHCIESHGTGHSEQTVPVLGHHASEMDGSREHELALTIYDDAALVKSNGPGTCCVARGPHLVGKVTRGAEMITRHSHRRKQGGRHRVAPIVGAPPRAL